ncbi:hypothetical protein CVT25_006207 [Psilocybe cyanescens]|uniref:Uncharacterized protein n=1 Tax=Psilocybe cyanescens TaxID=93625 RepID=A0A409XQD9_PSICY|nr:hypothetical protein CVT25_006207 [Psilocybe cyanescens]
MQDLYETERARLQIRWYDRFKQLHHSYVQQLVPLGDARKNAVVEEERQRKLLEKMIPLSKEDFDSKRTETKLRAARFLVADSARQERLLNDYGWALRQVQLLIDIFNKDMVIASNVRGMVISSQNVTDPRRPRLAA